MDAGLIFENILPTDNNGLRSEPRGAESNPLSAGTRGFQETLRRSFLRCTIHREPEKASPSKLFPSRCPRRRRRGLAKTLQFPRAQARRGEKSSSRFCRANREEKHQERNP